MGGYQEAATARVYWAMAVGMAAALMWLTAVAEASGQGATAQCAPSRWMPHFQWWWGLAAVGVGFGFGVLEAQRLRLQDAAPSSARGVLLASSAASTMMMFVAVWAVGRAYRALFGTMSGGPSSLWEGLWLVLSFLVVVVLHEACHLAVFRALKIPARLRIVLWPRLVVATAFDERGVPPGVLVASLLAPAVLLTVLGFVLMTERTMAAWVAWGVAANWAGSVPDLGRLAMLVGNALRQGVGSDAPAAS